MIALLAVLLSQSESGHAFKVDDRPWLKAEVRVDGRPTPARLDALKARGVNAVGVVAGKDWDEFFVQAEERGLAVHVVLGKDYKEVVSRFSKHRRILWSIPAEGTDAEQRARAAEVKALDPKHPVTVNRKSLEADDLQVWPHLGFEQFGWASVRVGDGETRLSALKSEDFAFPIWANREKSDAMSHPLPVSVDASLVVDVADDASRLKLRSQVLYPVYLSGGSLGMRVADGAEAALDDLGRAHRLVAALPFAEMSPNNALLSDVVGNFCYAKPEQAYAVYLAKGAEVSLDLRSATGKFKFTWVDVRTGTASPGPELSGGDWRSLGRPPVAGDVSASITR